MKKIILNIIVLLGAIVSVQAQNCEEMLDSKTILANELGRVNKTLNDTITSLRGQNQLLVSRNRELVTEQEATGKSALAKKLKQTETARDSIAGRLRDCDAEFVKKRLELEEANRKISQKESEYANLNQQCQNKDQQLNQKGGELAESIRSYEAEKAKNNTNSVKIGQLEAENNTLKTEKTNLALTNSQLTQEVNEANTSLKSVMRIAVRATVQNCCDDNPQTVQTLIQEIEKAPVKSLDVGTKEQLKNDLKDYLAFVNALKSCKDALSVAYQAEAVSKALAGLQTIKTFCPAQRTEADNYKRLLEGYCKESKYAFAMQDSANTLKVEAPEKAKGKVRDALNHLDDGYIYLEAQFKKKLASLGHNANFPSACN